MDDSGQGGVVARRHAVIAGTGRAGTSFLVRFLEHCGLDTSSEDMAVDPRARAGLEHNLFEDSAPYVVKDPWLFSYCDQIDERDIAIDVLLVPVRELMAASTSRVLQERIVVAERELMRGLPSTDVNGAVAGGVVYSLDPVDQARILAVGFHRLVHWAVSRRIPLILLEFPRIVTDGDYLIDALWPWLGEHCDKDRAFAAFEAVADPEQVRVEGWAASELVDGESDAERLDRAGLKHLLHERDLALAALHNDLADTQLRLAAESGRLAETTDRLLETETRAAEAQLELAAALAAAQEQLEQESDRLAEAEATLHEATAEARALQGTWSWRLTRPLRSARGVGRRDP